MKKFISLALVLMLAVSAGFSAFAAEQNQQIQKTAVSLSTIENIMETYNYDIKTITNNLHIARNSYNDVKDTDDASEKSLKNQYKIAQTQYNEKVQQQVLSAKQQYLAYCEDASQLTADQTDYSNKQAKLSSYQQSLAKGYISQKDYDDYSQNVEKAKSTLQAQDAKVTRERAAIRTLLNIPSTETMDIQPVSETDMDFTDISKINYGQDVIDMLNNNAEIQAAGLSYDYTDANESDNYQIDNSKISLEQTANTQKAEFKKLYDTLMDSYNTYIQGKENLSQAQSKSETEKQKLALGYTSQQKADAAALELQTLSVTLTSEKNTLYTNYLQYINIKNGYTGSSSK